MARTASDKKRKLALATSFPPLAGADTFNSGAGMSRFLTLAAYAMHNMPIGTAYNAPVLSDEDAYDSRALS
jgi:thiosulfate dehydrogenase